MSLTRPLVNNPRSPPSLVAFSDELISLGGKGSEGHTRDPVL
jgi:hypothetical protein